MTRIEARYRRKTGRGRKNIIERNTVAGVGIVRRVVPVATMVVHHLPRQHLPSQVEGESTGSIKRARGVSINETKWTRT
jgi:hypothetical protein